MGQALDLAAEVAAIDDQSELMVIGGAAIYAAAIPFADCLYVTEVHATVEGDAHLPAVDWSQWQEVSRERHDAEEPNTYDFSFVVFRRR